MQPEVAPMSGLRLVAVLMVAGVLAMLPSRKPGAALPVTRLSAPSPAPSQQCPARESVAVGGSYAGQDLKSANFSGKDLTNADFSDAVLTSAMFLRANLAGANFSGATF